MLLKVTNDYVGAVNNFKQIILDEVNLKQIEFVEEDDKFNDQSLVLNFRKAGAVLKGDVNKLKQALVDMDDAEMKECVKKVLNKEDVEIEGFPKLGSDMFEIKLTPKKEFAIANLGNNLVVLDIELSAELVEEGKLRELIRELQVARKEAGLNIDDRIVLNLETNDKDLQSLIAKNIDAINAEVLCVSNQQIGKGFEREIEIDGKNILARLAKK